jgi:hypothetical protein
VLDKTVEPENPNGLKAVLLKTAADQLFWAPIMTCVFFVVLKSLEGHPELIWPTIQVDTVNLMSCGPTRSQVQDDFTNVNSITAVIVHRTARVV